MRKRHLSFKGQLTLTRILRETGEILGVHKGPNTVVGLNHLCKLIAGDSSDHLGGTAKLQIQNESNSDVPGSPFTAFGAPLASSGGQISIVWKDNSTNAYDADDFYIKTNSGSVTIGQLLNKNWTGKTADENWHYTYTLTLVGGAGFNTYDGEDLLLDLVTGQLSTHLDQSNTQLRVYTTNSGGADTQVSGSPFVASSHVVLGATITYTYTIAPGARSWERVAIWNGSGTPVKVWEDDSISKVQGGTESITYTAVLTLT